MDGLIIALCGFSIYIVLNGIQRSIDKLTAMLEGKKNEASGNGENKNE